MGLHGRSLLNVDYSSIPTAGEPASWFLALARNLSSAQGAESKPRAADE
jgi:hypothetical protein